MNIYKDVFILKKKEGMSNEKIIEKFNKTWNKRMNSILKFTKEQDKEATYKFLENKKYEEYIKLLVDLNIVMPLYGELLDKMDNIEVSRKSLKKHFEGDFIINKGIINLPLINFEHQWLEYDGKVYNTTFHLIYPIEYYYDIYNPNDVYTLTNEEIEDIKNNIFNRIKRIY